MHIADNREKLFFLLGGHDLEMLTIRQVLDEQKIVYADHGLRWDNALLSSYQKELEEMSDKGFCMYGIELREDIPVPLGYRTIDHHNDSDRLPSALEQVMSILRLPMNRHLQLVAANDKLYIPGLLKLGATAEEIAVIRRADRKAQGVTDEDEQFAEKAINENKIKVGDLWVIRACGSRFSPICDRMFPYRCLLVYTDSEWMYYGEGADMVRKCFEDDCLSGNLFYGGGENGYVGVKYRAYSPGEIQKMIERIKTIER